MSENSQPTNLVIETRMYVFSFNIIASVIMTNKIFHND